MDLSLCTRLTLILDATDINELMYVTRLIVKVLCRVTRVRGYREYRAEGGGKDGRKETWEDGFIDESKEVIRYCSKSCLAFNPDFLTPAFPDLLTPAFQDLLTPAFVTCSININAGE